MQHTKFRENRPVEEDFWMVFYHKWAWQPSWSCDPAFKIKLSFPLSMDAPHRILL